MSRYIINFFISLGVAILSYVILIPGCSPTQFGNTKTISCEDFPTAFRGISCIPVTNIADQINNQENPEPFTTDTTYTEFTYSPSLGKVDIIFVVDNSSSMAQEHQNLARQFKKFLNNIKDTDYHLAVITTDISASPNNPVKNAYYQDGKFIPIGGRTFLRNNNIGSTPSARTVDNFINAIVREETQKCDQSGKAKTPSNSFDTFYVKSKVTNEQVACPSGDERAIYALNLAINQNYGNSFFRPDSHAMFVILSDEDERSGEAYRNQGIGFEQYELEAFDYPEVLAENFYNRFKDLKSFSVHAIVVLDGQCLNKQNRRSGSGQGYGRAYRGTEYILLAKASDERLLQYGNILKGNTISICNKNYGSQLGKIAIHANTIKIALPCGQPESINLFINNRRSRVKYTIEGRTLVIEPGQVRINSDLQLKIICEN